MIKIKLIIKTFSRKASISLADEILKLDDSNILQITHAGVGDILESDILLAEASNSIIIGLGVVVQDDLEISNNKAVIKMYDSIDEALLKIKELLIDNLRSIG